MEDRFGRSRSLLRSVLGWPARRLLDKRIEWVLANVNERHDRLEIELGLVGDVLGEVILDRRLSRMAAAEELVVPIDTARFLNWAEGPAGPAARAGLWFNPPVPVRYEHNAVEVLLVNERIVEAPYVFGALGALRERGRILDVGGGESTIGLSLACLGHRVHVVDPRGYRLAHPLIEHTPTTVDQLRSDLLFDAAIAVSSIEHFGLGAYGQRSQTGLDRATLATIREHLAPGGLLVLTVPCALTSSEDDFQRVYSFEQLSDMLAKWDILDLSVAWHRDRVTWVRGTPHAPQAESGVALVTARRAP
jgi:hypothetical protein